MTCIITYSSALQEFCEFFFVVLGIYVSVVTSHNAVDVAARIDSRVESTRRRRVAKLAVVHGTHARASARCSSTAGGLQSAEGCARCGAPCCLEEWRVAVAQWVVPWPVGCGPPRRTMLVGVVAAGLRQRTSGGGTAAAAGRQPLPAVLRQADVSRDGKGDRQVRTGVAAGVETGVEWRERRGF